MRRLNFLWIGMLFCSLASGVPACSDNETEVGDASAGGSGGSSGSSNNGNPTNTTTTGTNGGVVDSSQLGIECENTQDCPTGLTCLTSRSDALGDGGPAHGFCTLSCGDSDATLAEGDETCQAVDPESLCFYFDSDSAYCVPRCTFGAASDKCQGRDDVVCDLIVRPNGDVSCTRDADCDIGDVCLVVDEAGTGQCFSEPQVCLPRCNSDSDCPPDRYCSPSTGSCVDDAPTGKAFGEECDPAAEPDECAGFCSQSGRCLQKCIFGSYPACGSTSTTEATADCFFLAYPEATGVGDVGLCGALCDCTADCPGILECIQITNDGAPVDYLGRPGYCATPEVGDPILSECDGGGGGAGGAAGAAGQGGSP